MDKLGGAAVGEPEKTVGSVARVLSCLTSKTTPSGQVQVSALPSSRLLVLKLLLERCFWPFWGAGSLTTLI